MNSILSKVSLTARKASILAFMVLLMLAVTLASIGAALVVLGLIWIYVHPIASIFVLLWGTAFVVVWLHPKDFEILENYNAKT